MHSIYISVFCVFIVFFVLLLFSLIGYYLINICCCWKYRSNEHSIFYGKTESDKWKQ